MKQSPLLSLLLTLAVPALATEWHAVGPRSIGMGGTGVALTRGPNAAYWNPAALGKPTLNAYGVQIPFGAHYGVTGDILEGANNLERVKDECSAGGTNCQAEINDAIGKLDQPGNGLRMDADLGVHVKAGRLALFIQGFADLGAMPTVDRVNTSQADIVAGNNQSRLTVKGAALSEFGAGYGHELPLEGLYLGGNLKAMSANVGHYDHRILREDNDFDGIFDNLTDNAERSSNFGLDAGLLWDADRTFDGVFLRPQLGIVARNLNNPKFDRPAAAAAAGVNGKFAYNPQVRAGVAISPFPWWHVATDLDLTKNLTVVDGYKSRQWGVGTEVNVINKDWFNLPLRFGIARNLENASAGTILTGGLGLNFLHFILDASAQVSNRSVTSESARGSDERVPREARFGVSMSVLFGGSEEERRGRVLPPVDSSRPSDNRREDTLQVEKVKAASEKAHQELDKRDLQPVPTSEVKP